MNKLSALTFCLITLGSCAFSQTVNNVPLKDIDVEYIQIIERPARAFRGEIAIAIDFGQKHNLLNYRNEELKDENGQLVTFNSMMGALNYLSTFGYEFVEVYSEIFNDESTNRYLLRRKKE